MSTRRSVVWLAVTMTALGAVAHWASTPPLADAATEVSSRVQRAEPVTTLQAASLAGTRPDIVWLLVDDMRADDLRFMPSTRRLLVDQGVRFRNSFAPYSWCCPARASLLSGQYSHNHGVLSIYDPYGFRSFDDSSTLPVWLRGAGYRTMYVGKYLNGYGTMPEPGQSTGTSTGYRPPGWTRWYAAVDGLPLDHPKHGDTYHYYDTTLSNDSRGFRSLEGRYQTAAYADLTEDLIGDAAPRAAPYLLMVSYTAPHNGAPRQPSSPSFPDGNGGTKAMPAPASPRWTWGDADDRVRAAPGADWVDHERSDAPDYLAQRRRPGLAVREALRDLTRKRAESLLAMDRAVARTIEALRRAGSLDETMIVLSSDNGYFLGEQYIRTGKLFTHEPSIRVPTVIRGPGIPRGVTRTDPITSIDVAPTLAEVAGATPSIEVDGTSVLATLVADEGWRRGLLLTAGPHAENGDSLPGARDTDQSGTPVDAEGAGPRDQRWLIGVRTPRWAYWDLATGEEELYDLQADPEQHDNRAADPAYADVRAQLRDVLAQLRACRGAGCRADLPVALRGG